MNEDRRVRLCEQLVRQTNTCATWAYVYLCLPGAMVTWIVQTPAMSYLVATAVSYLCLVCTVVHFKGLKGAEDPSQSYGASPAIRLGYTHMYISIARDFSFWRCKVHADIRYRVLLQGGVN